MGVCDMCVCVCENVANSEHVGTFNDIKVSFSFDFFFDNLIKEKYLFMCVCV